MFRANRPSRIWQNIILYIRIYVVIYIYKYMDSTKYGRFKNFDIPGSDDDTLNFQHIFYREVSNHQKCTHLARNKWTIQWIASKKNINDNYVGYIKIIISYYQFTLRPVYVWGQYCTWIVYMDKTDLILYQYVSRYFDSWTTAFVQIRNNKRTKQVQEYVSRYILTLVCIRAEW